MVKLINKLTCGEMWVAEDRVEEYKAAGHKPAAKASSSEKKPTEKPKAKSSKK